MEPTNWSVVDSAKAGTAAAVTIGIWKICQIASHMIIKLHVCMKTARLFSLKCVSLSFYQTYKTHTSFGIQNVKTSKKRNKIFLLEVIACTHHHRQPASQQQLRYITWSRRYGMCHTHKLQWLISVVFFYLFCFFFFLRACLYHDRPCAPVCDSRGDQWMRRGSAGQNGGVINLPATARQTPYRCALKSQNRVLSSAKLVSDLPKQIGACFGWHLIAAK